MNAFMARVDLETYRQAPNLIREVRRAGLNPADRGIWEMVVDYAMGSDQGFQEMMDNTVFQQVLERMINGLVAYRPGRLRHFQNLCKQAVAQLTMPEKRIYEVLAKALQ